MNRYGQPRVAHPRTRRLVCWVTKQEAQAIVGDAQQRGRSVSTHLRALLSLSHDQPPSPAVPHAGDEE